MSKFTIIEDCSPYYIRFTHDDIDKLIDYCKTCLPSLESMRWRFGGFNHCVMSPLQVNNILLKTPISKLMPLQTDRVSLFISKPGLYYRAHKDGLNHRFSINYAIKIDDDKCVTNWWSDEDLAHYAIDNLPNFSSRECVGFDPKNHIPLKSMIAKPGEAILFNTEIFHNWDMTASENYRVILTLRIKEPLTGKTYFEDAKKIIFGQ